MELHFSEIEWIYTPKYTMNELFNFLFTYYIFLILKRRNSVHFIHEIYLHAIITIRNHTKDIIVLKSKI